MSIALGQNKELVLNFDNYQTENFYDELLNADGQPRDSAIPLINQINQLTHKELKRRKRAAEVALFQLGNTFNVYQDKRGTEKILPFDIIPRIITKAEWTVLETGLKQRIEALNLFIQDIYHQQRIIKDKIIPRDLILNSACYLKQCHELKPQKNIWIHISGTDLVRDKQGHFYVLEDNLRCPSGISYVLEGRSIQKKIFPNAFKSLHVKPISDYPDHLYDTLCHLAPDHIENPRIVVLTPGIFNSAYFEHAYLAQQMGVTLAQGSDLAVIDDHVILRSTKGFEKVDVIYRRIDDLYLDPEVFLSDSLLGVPGLMRAYQKGNVALANAPGTGIADDKAIYAYVPKMIRYYLQQDAILPNVSTYLCREKEQLNYVLNNIDKLVIKAVNGSGGYGMLIGPESSQKQREEFSIRVKSNPEKYIAQPTLALSRSPSMNKHAIEGLHVDIRPFILYGKSIYVLPGGLTRVAKHKGTLVVNSSQGGGSKDTWVLD